MNRGVTLIVSIALITLAGPAFGQSSSLLVKGEQVPAGPASREASELSPAIADVSLFAVGLPQPRQFAVHDLITIIVRESIENDSEAELETEKDLSLDGEISAFPRLSIEDLIDFQLQASQNENPPKVGISFDREFESEGEHNRRDTMIARITAEIIDIKPNGTLVLEARKMMKTDKEQTELILSGVCRAEDVTADNTVLSTQMHNLRITKEHEGELRNATKKGLLTKVLEVLFAF